MGCGRRCGSDWCFQLFFVVSADQITCAVENGLLKNAKIGGRMLAEVLCGRLNQMLVGVWSAGSVKNGTIC